MNETDNLTSTLDITNEATTKSTASRTRSSKKKNKAVAVDNIGDTTLNEYSLGEEVSAYRNFKLQQGKAQVDKLTEELKKEDILITARTNAMIRDVNEHKDNTHNHLHHNSATEYRNSKVHSEPRDFRTRHQDHYLNHDPSDLYAGEIKHNHYSHDYLDHDLHNFRESYSKQREERTRPNMNSNWGGAREYNYFNTPRHEHDPRNRLGVTERERLVVNNYYDEISRNFPRLDPRDPRNRFSHERETTRISNNYYGENEDSDSNYELSRKLQGKMSINQFYNLSAEEKLKVLRSIGIGDDLGNNKGNEALNTQVDIEKSKEKEGNKFKDPSIKRRLNRSPRPRVSESYFNDEFGDSIRGAVNSREILANRIANKEYERSERHNHGNLFGIPEDIELRRERARQQHRASMFGLDEEYNSKSKTLGTSLTGTSNTQVRNNSFLNFDDFEMSLPKEKIARQKGRHEHFKTSEKSNLELEEQNNQEQQAPSEEQLQREAERKKELEMKRKAENKRLLSIITSPSSSDY